MSENLFGQTFVDESHRASKPLSLLVSTAIQIGVLGILLLIPLIYTATLPNAMFKSFLVAPRPPVAPPAATPVVRKALPGKVVRIFNLRQLVAPSTVPHQVNQVNDAGAPPEVAGVASGEPTGAAADLALLGASGSAPPPPQPEAKPAAKPSGPIHVSLGAQEAKLIRQAMPVYPSIAKAARVQGSVEFRAVISKQGNIENLQVVRGHPLLVKAAEDAVLAWKYRPTLLNGEPVEVVTEIVVNFTLTQ